MGLERILMSIKGKPHQNNENKAFTKAITLKECNITQRNVLNSIFVVYFYQNRSFR